MFQANVLARVRVKVKCRVSSQGKARHKLQGKAEKELMLVGAAKEIHNSSSRSKAGLFSTFNSIINCIIFLLNVMHDM